MTLTSAEIIYTAFAKQFLREDDPKTLNEARESPDWPEWEKAINNYKIWVPGSSSISHQMPFQVGTHQKVQ